MQVRKTLKLAVSVGIGAAEFLVVYGMALRSVARQTRDLGLEWYRGNDQYYLVFPFRCSRGCHPVMLFHDMKMLELETVRTPKDVERLLQSWGEEHKIPGTMQVRLFARASEQLEQFNTAAAPTAS